MVMEGDAIVLPTLGGGVSGLITSASEILQKVDSIPFAQIGNNAAALLATLNATVGGPEVKQALNAATGALVDVQGLVKRTDAGLTPLMRRLPEIANNLDQTLSRASQLVGSVNTGYGTNSQFSRDLDRLMSQFNDAARSIRLVGGLPGPAPRGADPGTYEPRVRALSHRALLAALLLAACAGCASPDPRHLHPARGAGANGGRGGRRPSSSPRPGLAGYLDRPRNRA